MIKGSFTFAIIGRVRLKRRWDDETANSKGEQTGGCLCDGHVEVLLDPIETTEEEAHSQDQEQVGEYTAN